jgi:DNA-binding SARP family transcriptional activator
MSGIVELRLLDGFEALVDGETVTASSFERPQGATLVKLLALAPGRRLHREQVMDRLWPDSAPVDAAPRLHKAAYFARKALGSKEAVVLRADTVLLFPDGGLAVDVEAFDKLADQALASDDQQAASDSADAYTGVLLPEDRYEDWAEAERDRLSSKYAQLLRAAHRYDDLVKLDPADEWAHLSLMKQYAERGDRRAALRQYERLDRSLGSELGVGPGTEAIELRDQLANAVADREGQSPFVGRNAELNALRQAATAAQSGRGSMVVVSGQSGVGKTTLVERLLADAHAKGWQTGRGTAADVEGIWPYAVVLDVVQDLVRNDPDLLSALADRYREEIGRALAGDEAKPIADSSHQRLFLSVAELLRTAARDGGVVLFVDDLHKADEASLRLLNYVSRAVSGTRVLIVGAMRINSPDEVDRVRRALIGARGAREIQLAPMDQATSKQLLDAALGRSVDQTVADQVWLVSGGIPFYISEIANRVDQDSDLVGDPAKEVVAVSLDSLDRDLRAVLQRLAVTSATFDTDEFVALAAVSEPLAFDFLDAAIAEGVLYFADAGYSFRHALIREALLDGVSPHRRRAIHRDAGRRLEMMGASSARVAHHLLNAHDSAAIPHAIKAAHQAASVGAHRDGLEIVSAAIPLATDQNRTELLIIQADMLTAIGDRSAIAVYRTAVAESEGVTRRITRAKLARAAFKAGEVQLAQETMTGLDLLGDAADGPILIARGMFSYFNGDMDSAGQAAEAARSISLNEDTGSQLLDAIVLQGLVSHDRGEWFSQIYTELEGTKRSPALATVIFDCHLCVAEFLLYGLTEYEGVVELAQQLRRSGEDTGSLRAVAFAAALSGEAKLLSGDLVAAREELSEAALLHRDIGAAAGEAHSWQRLAEVEVSEGNLGEANVLLDRALPLARWSMLSRHLMQRVFGTRILAAGSPQAARKIVEEAEAAIGAEDACPFCTVMFAIPAAIACAEVGDIAEAEQYIAAGAMSAAIWRGTAWDGAVAEAKAHIERAKGDEDAAASLFVEAASLFARAGQPLDAARCEVQQLRDHHLSTSIPPG